MRASTERFVSSALRAERHLRERDGGVTRVAHDAHDARVRPRRGDELRHLQVARRLLDPASPPGARGALLGERPEQGGERGRPAREPRAHVRLGEAEQRVDRPLPERQAADVARGPLGPVVPGRGCARARVIRRRAQRERQCVSGPQSKAGCAASIAARSVVPERGPPTTKTGWVAGSLTGATLASVAATRAWPGLPHERGLLPFVHP